MKSAHRLLHLCLLLVIALVLGGVMVGGVPVFAAPTGEVVSNATPSDHTPDVGETITVTINIDMTGVNPPDNALGNYTGTLIWNPTILTYSSYSGAPPTGFTGVVNTANVGTGSITFNGANAAGGTGDITVLVVTFSAAAAGTTALDLNYTAMSAATTFGDLRSILTVNDGSVTVGAAASHTVTFNANGGSGTMSPQTSDVPTALTLNTFTQTGYTFSGWNTVAGGGGTAYADGATYSFAADITLYAQWAPLDSHTVTFNANGGSGSMSPQVANVPTALTLNTFTRTGYTFSGWNTAANGSGTAYADGATYSFAADITLYAQWTAVSDSVISSATPSNATPTVGQQIVVTINIDMTGAAGVALGSYTGTIAWNPVILDYVSNGGLPAGFTGVVNDTNADAGTITFNGANATGATGDIIVLEVTFSAAGQGITALDLAYSAMAGIGPTFPSLLPILTINDGSVAVSAPSHTVTFDANGGAGSMTPQVANVPTPLTLNTFTRTGYTFSGWNTAANGSGTAYADGATYSFAADITLYAQWSPASGSVISSATPSNATPTVGQQIVVTINIDMTGAAGVALGSFTGSIAWDPAILEYVSNGGLPAGFTGVVNDTNADAGTITFNGANAAGATGNIVVLTITFDVVGTGTTALDLAYSAMAAAITFTDLLPILTVNDGTVVASGAPPTCYALTRTHTGTGSDPTANPANSPGCAAGTYVEGATVTLTAVPGTGYVVGSWNGTDNDGSTSTTNQVTMPAAARTVTVNYVQATATCYALTRTHTGTGSDPTANPANSTGCPTGQYVAGAVIGLTASPGTGWSVGSWNGTDNDGSTSTSNQVTMPSGARTVTVNYVLSGGVTSTASPSNATPTVGQQIVVTINIDTTGAAGVALGSFTGSLDWNPAVLNYVGNTGLPAGFAGNVNTANAGSGEIIFNGANASGATGNIVVLAITFDVVGAGTSPLDLDYSAMAAAITFTDLLPILTINDGQVVATGTGPTCYALALTHTGIGLDPVASPANSPGCPTGQYVAGAVVGLTAAPGAGFGVDSWEGTDDDASTSTTNQVTMPAAAHTATVNYVLSGGVTSSATPSSATTTVGQQIVVTINIDMTGAAGAALGSFTGSLAWNPAVLTYVSNTGLPAGFSGYVNTANAGSGSIAFNGANASGATGNIIALTITFDAVGAGTTALDLDYSAMAAATTFADLLPILTINDSQVTVNPVVQYTLTVAVSPAGGGTTTPAAGTYAYPAGTVVDVTATAEAGYQFDSWSGACTGTGTCSVTMDADKTVTAHFVEITYDLTVAVDPVGSGTTNPAVGVHTYAAGTVVSVTATAAAGYTFDHWSGACSGTGDCQVTMDADKTVTAHFSGVSHELTIAVDPVGGGMTNPAVGVHAYADGIVVDITATPNSGYAFDYWSGACSGTGACQVTMDGDKVVIAHFIAVTHDLTVAVDPVGSGTTNPAVGVHAYAEGTVVDVTATPAAGYVFDHWSGACTGTGACSVTMDADKSVTAHFQITYDLTVAVNPIGAGTTSPAVGVHTYPAGTVVDVTATPAAGYVFDSWSGACTGTGTCSVTMDADKTVTANFTGITYDLTVAVDPAGGGTTNPAVGVHAYAEGTVVDVTATPAAGYVFDYWSGACTGTGACSVTMDANKAVTAHFEIVVFRYFLPVIFH